MPRFSRTVPILNPAEADETAEQIIGGYVAHSSITLTNRESSDAYYSPTTNTVVLPWLAQFESTSKCYSTAFHELTHSTSHASRLNRLVQSAYFGNEAYSREELVAERGSML